MDFKNNEAHFKRSEVFIMCDSWIYHIHISLQQSI